MKLPHREHARSEEIRRQVTDQFMPLLALFGHVTHQQQAKLDELRATVASYEAAAALIPYTDVGGPPETVFNAVNAYMVALGLLPADLVPGVGDDRLPQAIQLLLQGDYGEVQKLKAALAECACIAVGTTCAKDSSSPEYLIAQEFASLRSQVASLEKERAEWAERAVRSQDRCAALERSQSAQRSTLLLHTQECMDYAAYTHKPFCIEPCGRLRNGEITDYEYLAAVHRAAARYDHEPLPMVIFCACGAQHVDAPEPKTGWTNPPHRSHTCHGCGRVWRVADVPTVGVDTVATRGKVDTWPVIPTEGR